MRRYAMMAVLFVAAAATPLRAEEGAAAPAPGRKAPLELPPALRGMQAHFERVAREVAPSVAAVRRPGGGARAARAPNWSAVVIRADGYLLTNATRVAERPNAALEVLLTSGRRYPAKVVAQDPASDVAVLKIEAAGLPPIVMGDSDRLQVGQFTLAFGNPFNLAEDGNPAAAFGIVASIHRVQGPQAQGYRGMVVQTSAHLNPGNEGGALVDLRGRLIGLNGRLVRAAEARHAVSSAIPINQIRAVLPRLLAGQPPPRVALGFAIDGEGAVASLAADSAAFRAGLRTGDVVTHIDDRVVTGRQDVERLVRHLPEGTRVVLRVLRGDREELEFTVPVVRVEEEGS